VETVTLNHCCNCHLRWVDEGEFIACPRCRKRFTAPKAAVIAGVEVQVEAVVLYGDEMGLHDVRVRRGLAGLNLFERCAHGLISWRICDKCNHVS
jgi:hypothetical protein